MCINDWFKSIFPLFLATVLVNWKNLPPPPPKLLAKLHLNFPLHRCLVHIMTIIIVSLLFWWKTHYFNSTVVYNVNVCGLTDIYCSLAATCYLHQEGRTWKQQVPPKRRQIFTKHTASQTKSHCRWNPGYWNVSLRYKFGLVKACRM